jgi:hypothetical protein
MQSKLQKLVDNVETAIAAQQQSLAPRLSRHKYDEAIGYGEIRRLANGLHQRAQTLVADKDLSEHARERKLAEYGREIFGLATSWRERALAAFDRNITAKTEELSAAVRRPTPTDPVERLARELRLSEIRRSLVGLDPLQIQAVYFTATGELREAIETGPQVVVKKGDEYVPMPMIDPALVERRAGEDAQRQNPEAAADLAELQELRYAAEWLSDTLLGGLRDALGSQVEAAA